MFCDPIDGFFSLRWFFWVFVDLRFFSGKWKKHHFVTWICSFRLIACFGYVPSHTLTFNIPFLAGTYLQVVKMPFLLLHVCKQILSFGLQTEKWCMPHLISSCRVSCAKLACFDRFCMRFNNFISFLRSEFLIIQIDWYSPCWGFFNSWISAVYGRKGQF